MDCLQTDSVMQRKTRPERFVALDVETPNSRNSRMSAVGITVIEDGRIVDCFDSLVNPESGFDPFNIWLTGISEETADA